MASRRTVGVVALLTLLAVLACVTLMGLESSLLLTDELAVAQPASETMRAMRMGKSGALTAERSIETAPAPQDEHQQQSPNASSPSEYSVEADAKDTVRTGELAALESAEAAQELEESHSIANSTDVAAQEAEYAALVHQQQTEQPAQTTSAPSVDDSDELMTPELIHAIESRKTDPLAPVQIHLVWIGDISKAPQDRTQYTEQGYNLTVHTSAEEILDGFQPFVLKAYKQAIPTVVGYDFLKFALLYKHGGFAVDADTSPAVPASRVQSEFPAGCDVVFGKEAVASNWEKPVYRQSGGPTYGLNRPFQILNWAMAASQPRNKHIKWMLKTAMMHFFGLRDMEFNVVQDVSGSGLMTDYVALLHEKEGRSYRDVYNDKSKIVPAEGLCIVDKYLRGGWINHAFIGTWKKAESRH